ncbi:MAG: hypothetical protein ACJASM_001199 [Salibacteraceae bacterium]
MNTVNGNVTGLDTRITNDSTRLNGIESDLDTRIVNDSIRLNTVNGNVTGLDTRITNDSTRLNGIESDLDTRIVNDSTRLNSAITKAISDSTVLHSAMTDTASAIRADILWSEILTGINYSGTGRVGIGAATPGAKLDVRSGTLTTAITSVAATTSRNNGLSASAESAPGNTGNQFGILTTAAGPGGLQSGTGTGLHYGVYSSAFGSGAQSVGVFGLADNQTTGTSRGVFGQSRSTTAIFSQGVYGEATGANSGAGHNAGVVGQASGHANTNYGFLSLEEAIGDNNYGGAFYSYGAATGGKTNTGVLAYAESATNNIGLKADVSATTTGVNYAIYADAGSLATNKAGHFIGDVTITGDLAVAGVLSSDLDTRIVNDSTRLNSAITKAISDSTVLHSAMTDTASAIRADILWSEILTGINYSGTGRVGIGAVTPGAKLDVRGGILGTAITSLAATTGINNGLKASSESAPGNTGNQFGIVATAAGPGGIQSGTGTGLHYGVYSSAFGSGLQSVGVFGLADNQTTGTSRGVFGQSRSTTAIYSQGVYGEAINANSGAGHNAGVVGKASGHANTNYGFLALETAIGDNNYGGAFYSYGVATGGKTNTGVLAYANAATNNIGLKADVSATTTGINYAIWADAGSLAANKAGHFIGDVTITGDLAVTGIVSKASGSFKIDHPLDPENKYLVHSFVESPDMMNVYNGNITTDANGLATVELPQYVQVSNKDFRYQLTPIGKFAQCIVKEEVNGDKFIIQTNKPNVKVSWQVTGIRNDPFAKVNRIVVEQEKSDSERGKYLHPEVYGKDKSQSVHPTIKKITKEELLKMKEGTK